MPDDKTPGGYLPQEEIQWRELVEVIGIGVAVCLIAVIGYVAVGEIGLFVGIFLGLAVCYVGSLARARLSRKE